MTTMKGHADPANTKHLYNICAMLDQRRRRWANIVQMLYTCFVFTGEMLTDLRLSLADHSNNIYYVNVLK